MGNTNSIGENLNQQETGQNAVSSVSQMSNKKVKQAPHSSSSALIKCKQTYEKNYKTFETITICTHNEWLATNTSEHNDYNFKNVNKTFSCKGKCKETCTNGFCLYSVNIQTKKKLLSNRKFNYYTNDYRLRFRFKNFFKSKKKYTINKEAKKIMDHFKYNHLPAMFSSFHHYNVKGLIRGNFNDFVNETNNSLLLINIYSEITEKTRFVLINLKTTKFLSIFGDYHGYINASDVYCSWSPDLTKLLLRVNSNFNSNSDVLTELPHHMEPGSVSFIDFYDISKRDGKLIKRLKYFHKTVIFSFDPTCNFSRLAITDYYQEASNSMYIIDLGDTVCIDSDNPNDDDCKAIKVLSCSQNIVHDLSRNACDIKFSLDGSYIIVTIGDNICCCNAMPHAISEIKYLIFDAYSCQLLKYLSSHLSVCTIHMCPLTYLPKISTCQTHMAIPKMYLTDSATNEDASSEDRLYYNGAIRRSGLYSDHYLSSVSRRNEIRMPHATTNSLSTTNILRSFPFLNCSTDYLNTSSISTNKMDLSFVKIIQMPCKLSLKNFCRVSILRNIKNLSLIKDLPLPERLKTYLLFSPENI